MIQELTFAIVSGDTKIYQYQRKTKHAEQHGPTKQPARDDKYDQKTEGCQNSDEGRFCALRSR